MAAVRGNRLVHAGGWEIWEPGTWMDPGPVQLGELLGFELGEISFGDRDLVRHDPPPVYGCYLE
jgi:hypothetical protein